MTAEELYEKEFGSADNIPKESAIRLLRHFATALKLEREKYNKDIQEFAEWCFKSAVLLTNDEWDYYDKDGMLKRVTTSQLREIWEVETGRRNSNETD